MHRPRIRVDFNELVQPDVVLLSQTDQVFDSSGMVISLTEGLPIFVFEYNRYDDGSEEWLLADGLAEPNDTTTNGEWSNAAKWCCRIDERGVRRGE